MVGDDVVVDERAKRAILLAFKTFPMTESSAGEFAYRDRMPLKTRLDGVRTVPGAIVRFGSYLAPGVVCMPSYVNVGAYVDAGTMVDTWATVGSCAQIGRDVHLSGGVGIGGVLEPAQAAPGRRRGRRLRRQPLHGRRGRPGPRRGEARCRRDPHRLDPRRRRERPATSTPGARRRPAPVCVGSTRVKSFPGGDFGMPVLLVLRVLAPGEIHDKLVLNDVLREHGIAP